MTNVYPMQTQFLYFTFVHTILAIKLTLEVNNITRDKYFMSPNIHEMIVVHNL